MNYELFRDLNVRNVVLSNIFEVVSNSFIVNW